MMKEGKSGQQNRTRLVGSAEVMDRLDISRKAFDTLIRSDETFPAVRIGRLIKVDSEKFEAWLAALPTVGASAA